MCIPVPEPQLPELPVPLSASLPKPSISLSAAICCKTVSLSAAALVPALPPLVFNPGVAAALKSANAAIRAYVNALPLRCPRDP